MESGWLDVIFHAREANAASNPLDLDHNYRSVRMLV